jgi:PadR family transcriptional regulator PadR
MKNLPPRFPVEVPELLLLRLLAGRARRGYELAREIELRAPGALTRGEGCLYPRLHFLEAARLVRSRRREVEGCCRYYYELTARGQKRLATRRPEPLGVACLLAASAALAGLSGCVNLNTTYYDDAPRRDMRFASEQAATTFYNALLAERFPPPPLQDDGQPVRDRDTLSLLVVTPLSSHHAKSDHVIFNEAAAQADTNHDGLITEAEATAYANAVQTKLRARPKNASAAAPKNPASAVTPPPATP